MPEEEPDVRNLHGEGVGHDAVHGVFCEGVKVFVWSSHELRLQSVAASPVVLEHEEIQLHRQVCNSDQLVLALQPVNRIWEHCQVSKTAAY